MNLAALGRNRIPHRKGARTAAVFLLLLSLSEVTGLKEKETRSSSSQERKGRSNITILISESVTNERTLNSPLGGKPEAPTAILPTGLLTNSSYLEPPPEAATQRLESETLAGSTTTNSRNYYAAIKPTKSVRAEEVKIPQTKVHGSGERGGVSMARSRPQKTMSFSRVRRGFGSADEQLTEERKLTQKNNSGKGYNEIEQTLRKIAKVSINEDLPAGPTIAPKNFRESREEENRKASPDIQDIITGIVNILNGKNTKPTEGNTGRPRPTGTRINNRGPPRISDVPPLDFDGPPSYRPLPPPPPKRIPPPYPFDIPPPQMPNIPLPPQPHKPPSKLPPHPFIDGVPIPKIVIPDEQSSKQPIQQHPVNIENIRLNATKSSVGEKPQPGNRTTVSSNATSTNATDGKPDHKLKVSGGNKNTNKRVRPSPVIRPGQQQTNATESPITTRENTTQSPAIGANKTKETSKKAQSVTETPLNTSTSVTTVLNVAFEIKNKTETPTSTTAAPIYTTERDPILLEPSIGVGEATPVLETSILEISTLPTEHVPNTQRQPAMTETSHVYKARPGIVLDDPEYKPVGHKRPPITGRPIITAPPPHTHYGEIFDVTVHAVQGPDESGSGKPVTVPVNREGIQIHKSQVKQGDVTVITKPEEGQNFVSIDGKRTYINLFGEVSSTSITPTATQSHITGTGYAVPHEEPPLHKTNANRPAASVSPPPRRPYKRPTHPPVRIDTCIVGDDITCDSAQNEMCRTEDGVSSCHCRPGYNRRNHRDTCRRVVSMVTSLRVDRLYDRRVKWQENLRDPDSEEYQQLSYEASQAIESAMSMTPFSDDFINSRINSIYTAKNLENNEPAVYVNVTLQLEENLDTMRPAVKHDIQRHLLRVIQRRNNNVGNSAVWVDASPGSVLALQDVDECSSAELHDCHERAICLNTFGSFKCQCPSGSRDPWVGNVHREGRFCEMCSSEYCNNRGECSFEHGQQVCHCSGSFYGSQCEIDGEVLGVAVGASVAAAIIIVLTLICLCMWSRKWSREQKSAVGAGMGSPVFGYMATGPTVKTPSVGSPPYQVSLEDRIRWAQIADVMAKSNHYAQPEPVSTVTRTSFGGYPSLPSHTMSMAATLPLSTITPPVPLPRLTLANKQPMATYGGHSQLGSVHQSNHGMRSSLETSSSEEDADRVDLLGRNFNAPRPKSRTSVANQSGIYYDVDFDRSDAYSKQNTIPLNTYTLNPQHQVRPYFR